MKIRIKILVLAACIAVIVNCSCCKQAENTWNPTTQCLDNLSSDNTNFANLASDVKEFYELLHKKEWQATYERRWSTFRQDFPDNLYLKTANSEGKYWALLNYKILSVEAHNTNEAVLISSFIELPDAATTYATVRWRIEDGMWRCDAAGPQKLSIFRYTRM